ncbi:MAG TPA: sensor domain-containing protein [Streptosporangiaceae bacterium]|jgi:signal transduction histidine kinase|nr:sensor domain-containing protein [Streptosporangiaceae bacterium]
MVAAAQPRPAAAWGGVAVAAVRAVVSAPTWLALIHLLSGWVIGLVAFGVIVFGTVAGVGMLPFALTGVPVLWVVLMICGLYARAERRRFAVLLDAHIAAPAAGPAAGRWWSRTLRRLRAAETWKQFGYAVIRFPLATVEVVLVFTVWAVAVALFALPGYVWALPRNGTLGSGSIAIPGSTGIVAGLAVAGAVLMLAAAQLTRGLAAADAAVARLLLGPRQDQLRARIGQLERSRAQVVDSAEAERRRIERDLHDGAQQRLVALAMDLGRAKARFADDPDAARAIVDQAHAEAKEALIELRNLVRGVHPPVLSDRGLDAALSGLAALSPVPVSVRVDVGPRPPAAVEAIAYFVVAEALTNVAKHARATRAQVFVERRQDTLRTVIRDDGIGGADPRGQGLSGLADRVAGVDGRLSVDSPAGAGTVIEVLLPCGS